jgi:RNA polymerase sigma-70 factor, ECF subfamily
VADVPDIPINSDSNSQDRELTNLLMQITQGDEQALATFYDLTASRVYGLALYVLKDPSMADEVTLDVYLQIWQRANQFDPNRGKPMAWITILTRSRSIDRLRVGQKEKANTKSLDEVNDHLTAQENTETLGVANDQIRIVRKALTSLSLEQRQVIEMAYFGGLSQREIAEKIDKPLGTVKTRIRLGMINLRKALGPLDEGCVL